MAVLGRASAVCLFVACVSASAAAQPCAPPSISPGGNILGSLSTTFGQGPVLEAPRPIGIPFPAGRVRVEFGASGSPFELNFVATTFGVDASRTPDPCVKPPVPSSSPAGENRALDQVSARMPMAIRASRDEDLAGQLEQTLRLRAFELETLLRVVELKRRGGDQSARVPDPAVGRPSPTLLASLHGATLVQVRAALGPPTLTRVLPDGRLLWIYETREGVDEVIFRPDTGGQTQEPPPPDACSIATVGMFVRQIAVRATEAQVFIGPSVRPQPLTAFARGATLRVAEVLDGWFRIRFTDPRWGARTGFVACGDVTLVR
jgi:hypothetical protein